MIRTAQHLILNKTKGCTVAYSRQLISFAFVAEQYEATGDIVQGLLPLFAPLIQKRAGHRFDPRLFVQDVKETYDIYMPLSTAQDLAPRLHSAGYLQEAFGNEAGITYKNVDYLKVPGEEKAALSEAQISEAIEEFAEFCKPFLDRYPEIKYSSEELESEFLNRLVQMDLTAFHFPDSGMYKQAANATISLGSKGEAERSQEAYIPELASHIDFLAASFIVSLQENEPKKFELLVEIATGAVLAEVVLGLQSPPTKGQYLPHLTAFLDGPLLIDALGVSGSERREYALEILSALKAHKIQAKCFSHTVEEMRRAIKAPLDVMEAGGRAYGPTARYVRGSLAAKTYVRSVLENLEARISDLGVEVIRFEGFALSSRMRYFTADDETILCEKLGVYINASAKLIDGQSIGNVIRLREESPPQPDITKSTHIFVTTNPRLAERSTRYLRERGELARRAKKLEKHSRPGDAPACVSDRYLGGILWLLQGGTANQLSRKKLIANCSVTILPRQDLIAKMVHFLGKTDAGMAERFEAVMTSERATHYLMELTLGDPRLITEKNYEEIYRDVELIAGEKVRIAKDEEIKILTASLNEKLQTGLAEQESQHAKVQAVLEEKIIAQATLADKERLGLSAELVSARQDLREKELRLQELTQRDEEQGASIQRIEIASLQRLLKVATRRTTHLRWLIVLVLCGITGFLTIYSEFLSADLSNREVYKAAMLGGVVLISGLLAWFVPERIFEPWFKRMQEEHFSRQVNDENLRNLLAKYDVDWISGKVIPKSSSN